MLRDRPKMTSPGGGGGVGRFFPKRWRAMTWGGGAAEIFVKEFRPQQPTFSVYIFHLWAYCDDVRWRGGGGGGRPGFLRKKRWRHFWTIPKGPSKNHVSGGRGGSDDFVKTDTCGHVGGGGQDFLSGFFGNVGGDKILFFFANGGSCVFLFYGLGVNP